MKRLVLLLLFLGLLPIRMHPQSGQQLYFAQTAQGSGNGTSCANAYAYNDSTYGVNGTQTASWVAGNTINLCGTITVPAGGGVVVNGSGTSSAPITIYWQPNAILQAPYFSNGIYLDGRTYITINGGTNGILQNTANGSGLANHIEDTGIYFADKGANNITVENLTIANIYVHNPPVMLTSMTGTTAMCSGTCGLSAGAFVQIEKTSSSACNAEVTITSATSISFSYATISDCTSATGGDAADETIHAAQSECIAARGSDITIANNVMHDAGWCVRQFVQIGSANVSIYNNRIYNIDHGWITGTAGSGTTVGPFSFYSNQVGPFSNWNDSSALNHYHHDGIHCYSPGAPGHLSALNIYNNVFNSGTTETSGFTGEIFIEGANHSAPCSDNTSPINIFNNVFLGMTPIQNGYVVVGTGAVSMFNNTCIDNNPADVTSGGGSCYHLVGATGPGTVNFQNNVATSSFNLIGLSTAVSSITIDYNVYANGGKAAFSYTSTWPPSKFSSWRSAIAGDVHSTYIASAGLSSTGVPSAGSAISGAGTNLTSLCAELPPLCYTTSAGNTVTPVARPANGAWDVGAYPAASTATYSISGTAGVTGATISYTGTLSGSVTADSGGAFTISRLVNGTYTLTPSLQGYTFSPTSQSETVSGANIIGVTFTAAGTGTAATAPEFNSSLLACCPTKLSILWGDGTKKPAISRQ
jgi:acetyltransferase-like isoleucine patch superfamily enzyme